MWWRAKGCGEGVVGDQRKWRRTPLAASHLSGHTPRAGHTRRPGCGRTRHATHSPGVPQRPRPPGCGRGGEASSSGCGRGRGGRGPGGSQRTCAGGALRCDYGGAGALRAGMRSGAPRGCGRRLGVRVEAWGRGAQDGSGLKGSAEGGTWPRPAAPSSSQAHRRPRGRAGRAATLAERRLPPRLAPRGCKGEW